MRERKGRRGRAARRRLGRRKRRSKAKPGRAGSRQMARAPRRAAAATRELGRRGEDAAARFLDRRGYEIVERNWTCAAGEADIIARDGDSARVRGGEDEVEHCERRLPGGGGGRGEARAATSASRRCSCEDFDVVDVPVRFDVVSIVVMLARPRVHTAPYRRASRRGERACSDAAPCRARRCAGWRPCRSTSRWWWASGHARASASSGMADAAVQEARERVRAALRARRLLHAERAGWW